MNTTYIVSPGDNRTARGKKTCKAYILMIQSFPHGYVSFIPEHLDMRIKAENIWSSLIKIL